MFVPPLYRTASAAQARALIRRHPIAILTTTGDPVPWATHLPIIEPPDAPAGDDEGLDEMIGDVYWGHLNRANPHAASLADGQHAKLIFSGPDGYVSPGLYDPSPAVSPTWDFAAVHLEGVLELVTEEDEKLNIVTRTAAEFERGFGMDWKADDSQDYFRSIVGGVLGFTIRLTSVDAMMKLSQERSAAERDRIADWMEGRGAELGRLIRGG